MAVAVTLVTADGRKRKQSLNSQAQRQTCRSASGGRFVGWSTWGMTSWLANGAPPWSRLICCDLAEHLYYFRSTHELAFDYGLLG